MTAPAADAGIRLDDVSKFYGDVLGVNRVSLFIGRGVTSLVGPNGAGKTTLMHLVAGLLRPTSGTVRVLGHAPTHPQRLLGHVGYCTQYDAFPPGVTGRSFVMRYLRLAGYDAGEALAMAERALALVGLSGAADRKIAAFSKGMRQRAKLAQALAHDPQLLLLDEPLSGLDPMARIDIMALIADLASRDRIVLVSSHILHEVETMSDRVVLLSGGYVVADGALKSVRAEMEAEHPLQIMVRCDRPSALAARLVSQDHMVALHMHEDRQGLLVATRDAGAFYRLLGQLVVAGELVVESVLPADEDVFAVYQYLIGDQGAEE